MLYLENLKYKDQAEILMKKGTSTENSEYKIYF